MIPPSPTHSPGPGHSADSFFSCLCPSPFPSLPLPSPPPPPGPPPQVDLNSGGQVFFLLLSPLRPGEPEGVVVIKFGPTRLLMQAEQFANELTRHLDICAPECRIVRQVRGTGSKGLGS